MKRPRLPPPPSDSMVTPEGCNSEGRGLPGKGLQRDRSSLDWLAMASVPARHPGRAAQKRDVQRE